MCVRHQRCISGPGCGWDIKTGRYAASIFTPLHSCLLLYAVVLLSFAPLCSCLSRRCAPVSYSGLPSTQWHASPVLTKHPLAHSHELSYNLVLLAREQRKSAALSMRSLQLQLLMQGKAILGRWTALQRSSDGEHGRHTAEISSLTMATFSAQKCGCDESSTLVVISQNRSGQSASGMHSLVQKFGVIMSVSTDISLTPHQFITILKVQADD